ncbi:MAG: TVP38/TMEM64 family protein [Halosimplex sp.]
MRVFTSAEDRRRATVRVLVAAAALVALYLLARRYLPFLETPAAFRAWLLSFGAWAPVAFVGVQTMQVVVAPIPGQVVGLASGYVFGAVYGTLYSMLGTVLGTALAVGIARRYGRTYVERFVAPESLARFDDAVADEGYLALFVSFLLPGLPDDVLCFAAGLTEIPLTHVVALALVGRFPSVLLLNLAGARAADREFAVAGALLVALVGGGLVVLLRRERLLAYFEGRAKG